MAQQVSHPSLPCKSSPCALARTARSQRGGHVQSNRCALYALQACTLITAALARLEVGHLAVVAFGGRSGSRLLHALDQPWSDAAAQAMLGQLHFDADNTLRDTPMLDMLQSVSGMLERERGRAVSSGSRADLKQLLLIVADGHLNERAAVQQAVREATARGSGLLIVFIVLDTDEESILELQSVEFENGAPVFRRYLDAFPFPYYLVLRDIEHLPRLLADLLRQWLQLCTA